MTEELNEQFGNAVFLGAKISDTFLSTDLWNVRVLALVLVAAMTVTTFTTQRQLMSKNMPADALTGPYAQQQKLLLYVLPVVFAVGGIAFPIGVLFYWTTSNLWTMGQQFYVIRNNPAPGTPAFKAKQDRDAEKARRKGLPVAGETAVDTVVEEEKPRPQQRQQPKKQPRSQRKKQTPGQTSPQKKAGPQSKQGQPQPGRRTGPGVADRRHDSGRPPSHRSPTTSHPRPTGADHDERRDARPTRHRAGDRAHRRDPPRSPPTEPADAPRETTPRPAR